MNRIDYLTQELSRRILVLDGAMGTMIQRYNLKEEDFRGQLFASHSHNLKGCNEVLNLTQPEIIREIHLQYLQAGADIIETNTFNGTSISMADYALESEVRNINIAGAKLACEARNTYLAKTGKQCFVAGAMGPTAKSYVSNITDTNSANRDEFFLAYSEQIGALIDGGADIILIETVVNPEIAKIALQASEAAMKKRKIRLPVMLSAAFSEKSRKLLSGHSLKDLIMSASGFPLLSFGLNCSFGAQEMDSIIEDLCELSHWAVCLYPSAGLPLENGVYPENTEIFTGTVIKWAKNSKVRIIGGCCGTTPKYIQEIKRKVF